MVTGSSRSLATGEDCEAEISELAVSCLPGRRNQSRDYSAMAGAA